MDTQNSGMTPGSPNPNDPAGGYRPVHGTQPPYGQPDVQPPTYGQPYPPPPGGYPPNAGYPPNFQQLPYGQPVSGISDTVAGALAYITIIPAILFLLVEPYSRRPFVRFHAFQCLFLHGAMFVVSLLNIIPILGQVVFLVAGLIYVVLLVLCIVNALQGKTFRVPVIGNFAAQQAGLL